MSIIRPNTNDGGKHQHDSVYIFVPKLLVTQNMANRMVHAKVKTAIGVETIDGVEYRILEMHRHDVEGSELFNHFVWYDYETALAIKKAGTGVATVYQNTKSCSIDGINQHFNGGEIHNYGRGDAFTAEGYLKLTSASNDVLMGNMVSNVGWRIMVLSNGHLRFQAGASGIDAMSVDGNVDITTGSWVHWMVVYGGTGAAADDGVKIYTDLVKNTVTINTDNSSIDWAGARDFIIGGDSVGNYVPTKIDETHIWDAAFDDTQAAEIFNSGTPFDPSEHSLYETNCTGDYRFGDNIADDCTHSSGQIVDHTGNGNLTPMNTSNSNIVSDAA